MKRLKIEIEMQELSEEDYTRIYGNEPCVHTDAQMDMEEMIIEEQLRFGMDSDLDGNCNCDHCYGCTNCLSCSWCCNCHNCQEIDGGIDLNGQTTMEYGTEEETSLYVGYLNKVKFIKTVGVPEIIQDWREYETSRVL